MIRMIMRLSTDLLAFTLLLRKTLENLGEVVQSATDSKWDTLPPNDFKRITQYIRKGSREKEGKKENVRPA